MNVTTSTPPGTPPVPVTYEVATNEWVLFQDYRATDPRMGVVLAIRKGFRFDLASIPRLLWWRIGPHELSILGPMCHDALYRHGGRSGEWLTIIPSTEYTREQADELFRDQMRREGVGRWRSALAYRAVRWFGGGSWRD